MPLKPSPIFDDYWRFAYRRQEIFVQRQVLRQDVLSDDAIIRQHKFTNCYRVCDRVSQYLLSHVIYDGQTRSAADEFVRIVLFKLFNRIETWQFVVKMMGEPTMANFDAKRLAVLLTDYMAQGNKAYSAAYIMPSGKREFGSPVKHWNHLQLLDRMLNQSFEQRIWAETSLEGVYHLFLSQPGIGPFLAMQYATDIAYSDFSVAKESDFIVAGPGAKRGIAKCFQSTGTYSDSDVIRWMVDNQESEFERLELDFRYLKNRRLQLIDCQNLFCEVDKYCRVKYPDVVVGNTRIKQKYRGDPSPISFKFPPKWQSGLPMDDSD